MKHPTCLAILMLFCLLLGGSPLRAQPPSHDPQAAAHRARAAKLEAKPDYQGAIQEYHRAYALDKNIRLKDAALDLECIGINHVQLNQYDPQSLTFFRQALAIRRQVKDRQGEAATLDRLGVVDNNLARYDTDPRRKEAIACFLKAMTLAPGELSYVLHLAFVYTLTGDYPNTMALLQTRLRLFPAPDDQKQLQIALADMHFHQAESLAAERLYAQAITHYDVALALDTELRPTDVFFDWMGEGYAYDALYEYDHAIGAYLLAQSNAQAEHNKRAEAGACSRIAEVYEYLGNQTKSRQYFQQAYDADLEVLAGLSKSDLVAKSSLLSNLGTLADKLGDNNKALNYLFQALVVSHETRDYNVQISALTSLSGIMSHSASEVRALDYIAQALPVARSLGDNVGEVTVLSNTGVIYDRIGQYAKATTYYRQALDRAQYTKNVELEANVLDHQALTYEHLGDYSQALSDYQKALRIETQFKQTNQQAATLGHMMRVCKVTRKSGLAVLYGKQAVNTYQTIRASLLTLDKETQKDYAASVQHTYRDLADLLIGQGRLPEAEAVLALLKDAEFRQFNGADRAIAALPAAPVPLTTDEAQWQADYAALGGTLESLNQQATALARIDPRTPAQETEYRALTAKLDKADANFQTFLDQLAKHFTDAAKGNAATLAAAQNPKLMNALARFAKDGTRVAAVYTVEADSQYAVILVTPNGSRPGATTIKAADLNKKIEAFRQALTDPRLDPRPLGQELYKILVGPIEKDLTAYDPQVVMWSLDGQIRYLPVAALYDGKRYLVERWQNTLFDPASLSDLDQPRTDWRHAQALGLGTSKEHHVKTATKDDDFPALPHVPEELEGIIHDPKQA
ncbi:MAG: DUF2225 domain-containing protein, partial [Armatimonadota bacterium]|nr:DUF2225 domain-containing protein [Armatimonadota bacterium]